MSVRLIVRTFSEICITIGAVIILFAAYLLFWTGVTAKGATDGEIVRLREEWARLPVTASAGPEATPPVPEATGPGVPPPPSAPDPAPPPAPDPPPRAAKPYESGRPFAIMYIPRFGADWAWPVLEGTDDGTLRKGLGHYAGSARLGATGNFSVAGHRRTHGDPFRDFPRLRPGDAVVLSDGSTWFTYRIRNKPYRTVPGDVGVVDAVPVKSGFDGPGRYLTLTTCDPEWGSSHRLVVWAHLDAAQPVTRGGPEALHS
ncbi:sortase [Streptomyces spongiicola]|uniref:Sortase n=1 Tax=Streptomyces spongiicola TaxID=1690221 RepID=A0A2S1Z1B8_9ACTN|nr:class E sortase [Streptomyces spongiicola]AWK10141.1 class E sortase [Streptomyces spongiicola]GBQ00895.1 sortase [Streptomyces spongiicola]